MEVITDNKMKQIIGGGAVLGFGNAPESSAVAGWFELDLDDDGVMDRLQLIYKDGTDILI